MTQPLRIAVADDEADMRDYFADILPDLGHTVVGSAATGRELLELCRGTQPDLVISDIKMPDMDGIDAAAAICQQRTIPVILVSAYHDPELVGRAEQAHALAYLIKPIQRAHLETAIAIAWRRFEEFAALRKEAADLRQTLEDRKLIEQAKGILMKKASLSEADAFRRLQKLARDENRKMVDIARMILMAEKALGGA
jgi:response regulator NasT